MYSDTESSFSVNTLSHRRIESKAPRWTSESQVRVTSYYMAAEPDVMHGMMTELTVCRWMKMRS